MTEIKSAYERAMERAEKLGKASEDELRRWKYTPEGEAIAARCLKEDCDVAAEVAKYDEDVRGIVAEGAVQVLIRNIDLPRNEHAKKVTRKAMEATKELKRDKVGVENVYTKMRRVFNHYEREGEQQRKQTYEAVKRRVEANIRAAAQQQLGVPAAMNINVETQPQFQQELRIALAELDSQYQSLLEEYRRELMSVR